MPRKEFEAFTRLDASDVNTFLMDQSVMTFAGTAARGSAISTPIAGMTTYLEDTKDLQIYDGSAYNSTLGLVLLATASPSASSGVSFNNVFSSSYQNYQIYTNMIGTGAVNLNLRLRASGSDATTGYQFQYLEANSSTVSGSADGTSQLFALTTLSSTNRNFTITDLGNPFVAQQTGFSSRGHIAPYKMLMTSGVNNNNTSYDGCSIYPDSGTITGSIRIYGVRN
jgi:hypothetical protein